MNYLIVELCHLCTNVNQKEQYPVLMLFCFGYHKMQILERVKTVYDIPIVTDVHEASQVTDLSVSYFFSFSNFQEFF